MADNDETSESATPAGSWARENRETRRDFAQDQLTNSRIPGYHSFSLKTLNTSQASAAGLEGPGTRSLRPPASGRSVQSDIIIVTAADSEYDPDTDAGYRGCADGSSLESGGTLSPAPLSASTS
ncbi:uncharacterized protein CPUR_06241 [Claviceps purpurea 20.1]|uniref:Uncharacterized protein n=1 Tax=Claviceps purpurea (strain 20.1) TaxID=1111077 RepID=M1W331_CLAP2|nr:uncharacterized protein CPUR_06241 [Claviceps purpurea 20.1]